MVFTIRLYSSNVPLQQFLMQTLTSGHRMQVHDPGPQCHTAFTFRSAEDRPKAQDIVFCSYHSVETECALEILSLFMLSLCMYVESVGGKTEQTESILFGDIISNSLFTALAKQVIDAGLVEIDDEAFLCIIPAFARFGLLPEVD